VTRPILAIRGLSFRYPDGHPALDGVDLLVEEGERVALLGPNGAGKTTLAHHINGILEAQEGVIEVDGLVLGEDSLPEIRRRVGLVFQDPDDQLFMPTVADDVAFGPANLGLRGSELEHRVHDALMSVGAAALGPRPPHHLSGGEKRRAALAGVLAMKPVILVLDEPTSGLDPAGRREVTGLLDALQMTQLVITHDLPFALELCERAVIIDRGRVAADGPTADLLADASLLAAHRLEMPFGFDPDRIRRPPPGRTASP
jgi:cobalt/nickel transport system ATP-binding protein